MNTFSVVIIAKNEEHVIAKVVQSVQGLTDDIVVADTGSTDNTIEVAKQAGAKVEMLNWKGFGPTKNAALLLAKYDWILFLDADEPIDAALYQFLNKLVLRDDNTVYKVSFKNYFGNSLIRHGEWGSECKVKLFNRKYTQWNDTSIHEKVIVPAGAQVLKASGFIMHQLAENITDHADTVNRYAHLVAQKYYQQGKQATAFKLYVYPFYQFLFFYIFKLGFLDGRIGFVTAYFSAFYSFLKYHRLKELQEN